MLTPNDIDRKAFKKVKLGGYEINDVEDFLAEVLEDYTKLFQENSELRARIGTMQESVSYYKSVEEGINKTIENAQSTAEDIKGVATREAEAIKKEAEIEARKIIDGLKQEITRTEEKLEEKKKQMQIYKVRLTSMLEAQLKILNEDDSSKFDNENNNSSTNFENKFTPINKFASNEEN